MNDEQLKNMTETIINTERKLCAEGCLAILRQLQKNHGFKREDVRDAIEELYSSIAHIDDQSHKAHFINNVKKRLNEELD